MTHKPAVARTLQKLRRSIADFRAAEESIALVPTMGALHAGHLALMRRARRQADRVIVSIFVNPTQFAPQEDLSRYPRDFERDLAALTRERIDSVWAPSVAVMYPQGFATRIVPQGPASAGLEDAFRPHFFAGVATVVAKLLMQCRPDVAVFGEKDYQQLQVVTRLAQDLDIPTKIVGVPTVREKDGLALSSRNAYLSAAERRVAPVLHRVLADCAGQIAKGKSIPAAIADGRAAIEAAGFALDYLEARHARTLAPVASKKDGPIRVLAAARLGTTRLIDNVAV